MPERVKELSKPNRLSRFFLRLPIRLYQIGLGWVLGKRFLMLTHQGRKSGKTHETVIEVVRFDPATHIYYVASGWGEKSDWYQNILAHPRVMIQSGRDQMEATANVLGPDKGGDELIDYSRRHPAAWRELVSVMGFKVDGTEEDIRKLGGMIPIIEFIPTHPHNDET